MKIIYGAIVGALGCFCFSAIAQQQSPFQPPAVAAQATSQATMGNPIILNLTGVTVTDQSGMPVGPIQNILLSPAGCVDMAVLSLGGQKLVPVPWTLVSGAGATRGETEMAGRTTFLVKLDRNVLMQAPSVTVNQIAQLTQPQMIQQVQTFYSRHAQQTAAGGTGSQTGVNVGGSVSGTNSTSIGITNQSNISTQDTNFPPTGPTNGRPGRPMFETNRPSYNRPPYNRPPTNRPPVTPGAPAAPATGATPNQPGQPIQ
jgi:hypothetical protein